MSRNKENNQAAGAVELLEESLGILRESPAVLAWYYIGSLPFMLGLLFFWNDMLLSSFAFRHLGQAALGMSILFIWMKVWQSAFADRLLALVKGDIYERRGIRQIINTTIIQAAIQPWGFIILPVSLIIMLPFGKAYAFFQNVTVKGNGREPDIMKVAAISSKLADYQPAQNFIAIWLMSPIQIIITGLFIFILIPVMKFTNPDIPSEAVAVICMIATIPLCIIGILTALNISAGLLLLPFLLKTLFDIETPFSLSTSNFANSTFFALVWALSYLVIDPVMKTAYVLRCFYAESVSTGDDILQSIRRAGIPSIIALVLTLLFIHALPLNADNKIPGHAGQEKATITAVNPAELDNAIETVLKNPEYSWRMPREKNVAANDKNSFLGRVISSIGDTVSGWLKKAWGWIKKFRKFWDRLISWIMPEPSDLKPVENHSLTHIAKIMIISGLVLIALIAFYLVIRTLRERASFKIKAPAEPAIIPDIASADTIATDLSRDGWLNMARDLRERGDLRLSLRAFYLSTLAFLSDQELILIARYKTDTDYAFELMRKTRASALNAPFNESIKLFQQSWYGMHDVTPDILDGFIQVQERIRQNGQA